MIRLQVEMEHPGCADGLYRIQAAGAVTAGLWWADENGPLPDWTAFAALPIDPAGNGVFRFTGGRAVPREATHVFLRAVLPDKRSEEALAPLPARRPVPPMAGAVRLGFITDLHLSGKPWRVGRALTLAGEGGAVLCAGDMVNDGTAEQFARLSRLMEERLPPETPVLAVAGNHDFPADAPEGGSGFHALQERLLDRAERLGLAVERDESGCWAAMLGDIDIVGLNAAVPGRRLAFQKQGQLPWLDKRLTDTAASWHVVLCHAPLLAHNPQRRRSGDMPYFSRDGQLQKIVEAHRNILFLSGHTHMSMNCLPGCVEMDRERAILYVNGGSVRTTTLKPEEALRPKEWTDGNMLWLDLTPGRAEITAVSLVSGSRIARGYYRFDVEEAAPCK